MASGHFYIGSSVDVRGRWSVHKCELRNQRHRNPRLQNYWNKYGADAFTWEVIEEVCKDDLLVREQEILDSTHPFFNINPIVERPPSGGRPKGYIVTAETRAKLSKAHKGRKPSAACIAATIATKTGRIESAKTRLKKSLAMKGKNTYKRLRTHCIYGHPLPTGLRKDGRRLNCQLCTNRRNREYVERRRSPQIGTVSLRQLTRPLPFIG